MNVPRVLITGVGGFSGRWLVKHLRSGPRLHLAGLGRSDNPELELDTYTLCDLCNRAAVVEALAKSRPEFVYHLAGCNAFASPADIEGVNVGGFDNLVHAIAATNPQRPIRMLTIGSAAELGRHGAARLPVGEDADCRPESDYGRSKWRVTQRVLAGDLPPKVEVIIARTFNLAGPGLDARLALGNFAAQIAAVKRGEADAIRCGRLDTRRDYIDVRDAVAAYQLLLECGQPGRVYNVCSGRSHRLGDALETMLRLAGVSAKVLPDASSAGPGELSDIYGSTARTEGATGWRPAMHLEQSLADMLKAAGC